MNVDGNTKSQMMSFTGNQSALDNFSLAKLGQDQTLLKLNKRIKKNQILQLTDDQLLSTTHHGSQENILSSVVLGSTESQQ